MPDTWKYSIRIQEINGDKLIVVAVLAVKRGNGNAPFLSIFMYDGQPINQIDCWMVAPPRSRNTLDTLTQLAQKSVAFLIAVCYSILLYRSIMNGLVSPWHLLYCCSCRSL